MISSLSPIKCITLYNAFRFICKTETYVTCTTVGEEYYVGSTYKCYILFALKVCYYLARKKMKIVLESLILSVVKDERRRRSPICNIGLIKEEHNFIIRNE
jgi:hypothetical protein